MTEAKTVSGAPASVAPGGAGSSPVCLTGDGLCIEATARVARQGAPVELTEDRKVLDRMAASQSSILAAAERGEPVYGVTTGFGGMANQIIDPKDAGALQAGLIHFTTAGGGRFLPVEDVRAAMLLRANSHLHGVSGLRLEIVERLVHFLNAGVTPRTPEHGSIGASGDLVPLAHITGAVLGLDEHYQVDFKGRTVSCLEALRDLGLEPLKPAAKEGLAMINGTSVMTGMAAVSMHDARTLFALALGAHAHFFQGLRASNQSLHPFLHQHKPHPGQIKAAELLLRLLDGSTLARDELDGSHEHRGSEPIQDRYSMRCAPQFLGPLLDGLATAWRQVEVEMNSANDNPLIDPENGGCTYHGGNFLGQYVGIAMDQVRSHLALLAKHLDAQISLLVAPEFSNGLPACLRGNRERQVNTGLKGLQISGNSMMPMLCLLGNPLTHHFPTHAEQFNQNINSLGCGSARLARQSIEIAQQHIAVALIFGVQAVDLRTFADDGHYDAREALAPACVPLYEAVRQVMDAPISRQRPYLWDDQDRFLDSDLAAVATDIAADGRIPQAVGELTQELTQ